MSDTLKLVEQLIAEHKVIKEKTLSAQKAANDTSLLADLLKARDSFVSGRPNWSQNLEKLWDMIKSIDTWLDKHFSREENILLPAVVKLNNQELLDALETRLFEHHDLRERMLHSRERIAELINGTLASNLWEATYQDIQVYLVHTWRLLSTHAKNENHFFSDLRKQLKKAE
ncbi:MAG: hypothetical protein WC370_01425 [Dehalococcoidales bacterium]|jgi:iron-sulfur cluster repair protein YtfE (RIC family)